MAGPAMSGYGSLTARQRELHTAVVTRASATDEQLLMLYPCANRVGASEADVRAVREVLLEGHLRECKG